MDILEELKALDQKRAELLDGAKKVALEAVEKAIAKLNELGFNYHLGEGAVKRKTGTRQTRDVPCPICGFKTQPHHDARSHRSQKSKKAFTDAQLSEKGMTKV